jgi:8-oxo-dGTP diphosphatase
VDNEKFCARSSVDRTSASGAEDQRFESSRAHSLNNKNQKAAGLPRSETKFLLLGSDSCQAHNAKRPTKIGDIVKRYNRSFALISSGFNSQYLHKYMKKFKSKPGQIDFSKARWAPVINCVVQYKNKILIIQRSENLKLYPGHWNGVSGFLDDRKNLEQKVKEELREEIGVTAKNIISLKLGNIFDIDEPKYKKIWIIYPILVKIDTDKIKLDWEARKYEWIKLSEIKKYKMFPGYDKVLKALF